MTPTLTFSAGDGLPGHAHAAGLQVGSSSSLTIEEFNSLVQPDIIKLAVPTRAVKAPAQVNRHATVMTTTLKLGPGVGLKVSWVVEKVPHGLFAHSLWFAATGFNAANMTMGGLLGTGDRSEAATQDPSCDNRHLGARGASLFTQRRLSGSKDIRRGEVTFGVQ